MLEADNRRALAFNHWVPGSSPGRITILYKSERERRGCVPRLFYLVGLAPRYEARSGGTQPCSRQVSLYRDK